MKNQSVKEQNKESLIVSEWYTKFKQDMIHKSETTKSWLLYQQAYSGEYFKNKRLPEYKSEMISNYIFGIIETIRPILLDNDPKFQALPLQPAGMKYSSDLQDALMYEWQRAKLSKKLSSQLINFLVLGNMIWFVKWNSQKKRTDYIPVSPFNIFPDHLATSIEDADHIIYADYYSESTLKVQYPEKADKLIGSSINYKELIKGNETGIRADKKILVLEVYARDFETEEVVEKHGSSYRLKYPNGRVLVIAPELGLLLEDKANAYADESFPFVQGKNYDVPDKFWGVGDVAQLLSPQKHLNDINSAIVDNAKATANSPWIIDKNSGIAQNGITARPGLIIRKNPGSEVRREQPMQMPAYVMQANMTWKEDMEFVSGVHNTLRGENSSGVYTAQGVLALQEASMIRMRLKTKMIEEFLGNIGQKGLSRMRQYWTDNHWYTVTNHDGSYDMKKLNKDALQHEYLVKIVGGSTMPSNRGAMLDMLIRMAQTPMPDGQNLVDRETVAMFLPDEIRSGVLERMQNEESNSQKQIMQLAETLQQVQQAVQQTQQFMQQVAQESDKNDEQIFAVVEQITSSLEKLNKKIDKIEDKQEDMVKEQKEKEKIDKITKQAYNKGYMDAEAESEIEEEEVDVDFDMNSEEIPDDVLQGLENMSDEELAILTQQNPELVNMLK